jgi:uncharacterized protein
MFDSKLAADLKQSMLARDAFRTDVIKMLKSALMYAKIAAGSDLTEEQITAVVRREIKKRHEAVILQAYAPESLAGEQLKNAFDKFKTDYPDVFERANFGEIMKLAAEKLGDVNKQELAQLIKDAVA